MFKTGRFYNPINFDIKPGQTFTTFGQFLENLRPLTLKDFQIEHIQKLKSNEHKWIPFSWYKWRLGMKFLASSIVNPLTSSRMKGVVLQLQSPNKNHINGTQISGNLICTFSNPLIGRVSVKAPIRNQRAQAFLITGRNQIFTRWRPRTSYLKEL